MKTKHTNLNRLMASLGCAVAIGTMALSAPAEDSPDDLNYRAPQSSYSLIGMKVLNPQDQFLGRVIDLAIDLENGRLVEVIIGSSGGFLGLGQRYVAVPPGAVKYDLLDRVVRVDMEKERFKAAPALNLSEWATHTQSRHVAASYRYFGQKPYFAADGQDSPSGNTATEPLGHIQRNSKLFGMPVRNLQDEMLGKVTTVIFNLARGHVSHVIVMAPGYANNKSVIQPRALRYNATRDGLLLDVTKQAFNDEPRFRWTLDGKGGFQQETYVNTAVAANDGVNTKQNVQSGAAGHYTPLAQGTDFRDVDKTYRIYAAMRAEPSLSETAQNVEVGTLNGQTTLRGHVNNEAGKRTIGEIAAAAGRPENVSNLLEVRPPAGTNK
jgi:sporulation protein YlmC with PRC-barrel domain